MATLTGDVDPSRPRLRDIPAGAATLPAMRTLLLPALLHLLGGLAAQSPLRVAGLAPDEPLAITATATPDRLVLQLAIRPEWHLYGRDTGGGEPVRLTLADGCAFAAAGPPVVPTDAAGHITGEATITLPLARIAAGDAIEASFRFMACDPLMCRPPAEVTLTGTVAVRPLEVLLVALARNDRSERIAAFLRRRGFNCTIATYADVTLEQCDAKDLVLADSPLFEEARAGTKHARRFPDTRSPIVATGFLGTVLLEELKVAMACGYI